MFHLFNLQAKAACLHIRIHSQKSLLNSRIFVVTSLQNAWCPNNGQCQEYKTFDFSIRNLLRKATYCIQTLHHIINEIKKNQKKPHSPILIYLMLFSHCTLLSVTHMHTQSNEDIVWVILPSSMNSFRGRPFQVEESKA